MRAVVDAYGPEERAVGWYCYLENEVNFPFQATCAHREATSPLTKSDLYQVKRMADVEDCEHDMYVMVEFDHDELAVPLSQLDPTNKVDEGTREAVLDWHYWVERGYQF